MSQNKDMLNRAKQALSAFDFGGDVTSCEKYGNGHINSTFLVKGENGGYILQKINTDVFKRPVELMENISNVTSFLRENIVSRGGEPLRETLNIIPTKDGEFYYVDEENDYWRSYHFIDGAYSLEAVENPEDIYKSAVTFGRFQSELSAFKADMLHETIPNFHNTPSRYKDFLKAVNEDVMGRASEVSEQIEFIKAREKDMSSCTDMLKTDELPLRVTHNDTKLNNILIDKQSGEAICVIDLDTVMPGLSIFDFGDSIRFGANTAAEDERDLSKVSLDLNLFELYTKGFLEGCNNSLTENEVKMLPMGAKLMTLECGMRFLTDYLQGDVYFSVHRDKHNLDRCKTQMALVADMERKWESMEKIVEKYK